MAFGTDLWAAGPDEGPDGRQLKEAACDCWFTSTGRAVPRLLKYENEEGEICSISNIRVLQSEKKHYCGIPSYEYRCSAVTEDREYFFTLVFYPETCTWKWGAS